MSRSNFGGSASDSIWSTVQAAGYQYFATLQGQSTTMWSAATGGTQYTDLLLNGSPATSIPVGVGGVLPAFQGPDGITSMYADAGAGFRVRLDTPGGASGSYVQVTTNPTVQTVPAGSHVWLKFTDGFVGLDMVDQGDTIADMIDLRVRSTGDGVAVYHDGGASAATGITTGNVSCYLAIIPYYIDEHGSGRDGVTVNPRWNRTGLWAIAQPTNKNDRAIVAQSWSNLAAITVLNQDPAYPQGNGRAIDIVDKGNDSSILIQKSVAIGSNSNPKTRKATITLQDLSTGGTDPALGTPMQMLGIDDGTGTRLEIDSVGTLRWAVYNASASFGTQMNNQANGVLGMPSIAFLDANGNGALTGLDGIQKVNGSHVLQLVINGSTQQEWRNGSLGFFGTTAVSAKTGWGIPTGTASRATYATTTVSLQTLAGVVMALIQDLHQTAGYGLLRT